MSDARRLAALARNYVESKSSAYALTAADVGKVMLLSGTWTMPLPLAAVAKNGFVLDLRNIGTGVITLDPSGSEVVNGSATLLLYRGESVELISDGSAWYAQFRSATPTIFDQTLLSDATQFADIPLAGYGEFEFSLTALPNPNVADFVVVAQLSYDGGSTYPAGAAEYTRIGLTGTSAGASAGAGTGTAALLTGNVDTGTPGFPCRATGNLFPGSANHRLHLRSQAISYDGTTLITTTLDSFRASVGAATHMRVAANIANGLRAGSRLIVEGRI